MAALLLAIGLLSMAGIQASAVRLTKEAEFKSTAVEISSAFGEYLKANVGGVASYAINSGGFIVDPEAQDIPGNCDGAGAACTPAQIAAEDLARAQELARTRLPSGQIVSNLVVGAAGQSDSIDLWVMWLPLSPEPVMRMWTTRSPRAARPTTTPPAWTFSASISGSCHDRRPPLRPLA